MGYVLALWNEFLNFIGGRGGAVHWLLFVAALASCFFLGKRERRVLFWPSVLVLIFFFNPFFYKYVGMRFLAGVYWRLLWMLPLSFVVAYALTRVVTEVKGGALRIGSGGVSLYLYCGKWPGNFYNGHLSGERECI